MTIKRSTFVMKFRKPIQVDFSARTSAPSFVTAFAERPMLDQFLLLSMLLHVLAVLLLGDTNGVVARSGERLWGAKLFNFDATLLTASREPLTSLKPLDERRPGQRADASRRASSSAPDPTPRPAPAPASAPSLAPVESVVPVIERETSTALTNTSVQQAVLASLPVEPSSAVLSPLPPPEALPVSLQPSPSPTAEALRFIAKDVVQATTSFVVSAPTETPPVVAPVAQQAAIPVVASVPLLMPSPARPPREPSVSAASSATLNTPSVAALPVLSPSLPLPLSLAVPPAVPALIAAPAPASVIATIPAPLPVPVPIPAPVQVLKVEQAIMLPAPIPPPLPKLDTRPFEVPIVSPPLPAIKSIPMPVPVPSVPVVPITPIAPIAPIAPVAPVVSQPAPRQDQLIAPTIETQTDIKPADLRKTAVDAVARPISPAAGALPKEPQAKTNAGADTDIFGPARDGMVVPPVSGAAAALPNNPAIATPKLDLDGIRNRARAITSEGSGRRTLLPFPLAPPVIVKKNVEQIFDKALKRPDCRDTYAALGLAAVIPLVRDAVTENGCKW